MKKLLLITDGWHPQVSGMVTALEKITKLIKKRGFSVTVVHPGLCQNVPMPLNREYRMGLFPKKLIEQKIEKEKPDYIHIASEGPIGFTARLICQKRKLRFTTSYHTHFHLYFKSRIKCLEGTVYSYIRWFHSGAARTMVATKTLKRELESHGFKNIVLWPLGVDTEFFNNRKKASPKKSLPGPVFVYLGRLAPEKGVEKFLSLSLPGTKLVIGDGPSRKQLESTYTKNTIFVGYKQGKELTDLLKQGDVLVFPSMTETFGLVALEALACGIPVAAHKVMGPKDIITTGVDGFLGKDLKRAALACLTLDRSKCRKKALSYSWDSSVDAFISDLVPANL